MVNELRAVNTRTARHGSPSQQCPMICSGCTAFVSQVSVQSRTPVGNGTGGVGRPRKRRGMESLWHLFDPEQVEFRRLSEQVRDVSMNLKNKFRTSAYQVSA